MYSHLASTKRTIEVLKHFGRYTKHHLGQNFLINDSIIGRILEEAALAQDESVLEVGPGIGTLSAALLEHASAVIAVEKDRELEEILRYTLAQHRFLCLDEQARARGCVDVGARTNAAAGANAGARTDSQVDVRNYAGAHADSPASFCLVLQDALNFSRNDLLAACKATESAIPQKFVANLPYQVAATLVLRYFEIFPEIQDAIVMVQSEVCERMCAAPHTKTYGAYTAKLALFASCVAHFSVAPSNFLPAPHVMSQVIHLRRHSSSTTLCEESEIPHVMRVIDAAFAQRRKTVSNSLSACGFARDVVARALSQSEISAQARAETLTSAAFVALTRAFDAEGAFVDE